MASFSPKRSTCDSTRSSSAGTAPARGRTSSATRRTEKRGTAIPFILLPSAFILPATLPLTLDSAPSNRTPMSTVSRRDFATHMTAALSGAVAASLATPASAAEPMTEKPADSTPKAEDHQLAVLKEIYHPAHLTEEMEAGIRDGLKHNR